MAGRFFGLAALVASAIAAPQTQYNTASVNGANEPSNTQSVDQPEATPSALGGSSKDHYHGHAWVPHGGLIGRPWLSQEKTNGHSKLGTKHAPKLPKWLNGPMPGKGRTPWGGRNSHNTNQYKDTPNTGMTRHYDFSVAKGDISPDGVLKHGRIVNGQFPGPTIEANWGDWIEVVVHNDMDDEGLSLHWHGLLQTATPWYDGVPAVQQCPIAPGSTFTYRFRADLYGTSFYHSHYSAQYADGIFGPMIIHGPSATPYDEDLGPVLISDWYHDDYYSIVEQVMAPSSEGLPPPASNNNLINGKMNYPCSNDTAYPCTPNAGISNFYVESGKKYRLRLINAGAEGIQKFSIDGAKLTVIANDFVEVEPYQVDVVTLGIGQRSDVIYEATGGPTDAIWMRSTLGPSIFVGGCTVNDGISPEAVAAIYYQNADTTYAPNTTSTVPDSEIVRCENDDLSLVNPVYSITPTTKPDTSQNINITFANNGTNDLFYMNNSTFRADYNEPVLLDAKLGHKTYPDEWNVYDFGNSKSIRLVVYNFAPTGAHPMHMHGHNMYILAFGTGYWDGTVSHANNPQRRDVQLLPNSVGDTPGYIVVQIDADNPGVWPFHCHIAWHVSAGLYVNLLERPNHIKHRMEIPSVMAQTCRDWSTWSGNNVVDEIDSGL